jgi:hypothetical protein
MGFLSDLRNYATGQALKAARQFPEPATWIANLALNLDLLKLEGVDVQVINYDPAEGILELSLDLKGEDEPITLRVSGITTANGAIQAGRFESNREWLTLMLNNYAAGKPFSVPEEHRVLLEIFT